MSTVAQPLPFRGPPLPGEALPSWLCRLSERYDDFRLEEFAAGAFGQKAPLALMNDNWSRPRRALVETIAARTALPVAEVEATTFIDWVGVPKRRTRGHTGSLAENLVKLDDTIAVCPRCLAEDATPYVRKLWALSFMAACPIHGSLLVLACASCGSRRWRLKRVGDNLRRCLSCSKPLADAGPAHPIALRCQADLLNGLRDGQTTCSGIGTIGWPAMVEAVREIGVIWGRAPRTHARLVASISVAAGLSVRPVDLTSSRTTQVQERHDALLVLAWLLEDWPMRVVKVADLIEATKAHPAIVADGLKIRAAIGRMPWPFAKDLIARAAEWGKRPVRRAPINPWGR